MPNDTLWLNNLGKFVVVDSSFEITDSNYLKILASGNVDGETYFGYNSKNSNQATRKIIDLNKCLKSIETKTFDEKKEYYENIGNIIIVLICIGFVAVILYALHTIKKWRENPFEEDNDWVHIGSRRYVNDYIDYQRILRREEEEEENEKRKQPVLVYEGRKMTFKKDEIDTLLSTQFHFYDSLNNDEKIFFVDRVIKFIKTKNFKIHHKRGSKDMPILLAATAIQLSLGLKEYLLPHFENIHVYPNEFLGVETYNYFLVGNVSSNNINISWKHYLEGNENIFDGDNLGLHEMAHAYYCQFCIKSKNENSFKINHASFLNAVKNMTEQEKLNLPKIYSINGLRNEVEFFAESVELFFEKTEDLFLAHPNLFKKMSILLNQKSDFV